MNIKTCLVLAFIAWTTPLAAQTNFSLHALLHRPKDSVLTAGLLRSLDGFLGQKEMANHANTYILPEDLLETSLLVDELKQAESSWQFKDSSFYKCYLTNIAPAGKTDYVIQLSYMGVKDNMPYLHASFKLVARHRGDQFFFSSPLKALTRDWKRRNIGEHIFYYRHSLNEAQAKAYVTTIHRYDAKLKAKTSPRECYYCDNLPEALEIMGIDYKLEYNGYSNLALTAREHDTDLLVTVYNGKDPLFDPHDLWHARLRNVVPAASVNKPVDEACAFLYGGSWGLSWQEIYKLFMDKIAARPGADWLSLYEGDEDFGVDKSKPLQVGYMINAFIVQQLEKEKGFDAVKVLVSCGHYEKTNTQYFKTLEQLTGINRANFNERVGKLIRDSRKAG